MNIRTIIATLMACVSVFAASAQQSQEVISYLEIYDTETGTHQVIKEFPFLIEAPNWTPDGEWLVVNKHGRLYRIAPDGSPDLIEISTGNINQCNNDHVISA
jgi:Tol biopolymer transport system component